jgi:hypothetical protein
MLATAKKSTASNFRARRERIYARVLKKISRKSSKEVFASLVEAGIYTKQGHLTKAYRSQ